MTPLTTAALVFGIPNGLLIIHSIVRWFRPYRDTPCPGERDAHDALRDGGEGGEFRTIHIEGINP